MKINLFASALTLAVLFTTNCKSFSEKAGNTAGFTTKVEESWLINKPVETTPEIGDQLVTGKAEGTTFLGFIKTDGSKISGPWYIHLATVALKFVSWVPVIGSASNLAHKQAHSPFADDLENIATKRAIYDNGADGLYVLNVLEDIEEGLFTKKVTVTVTGKPIKTKYLGIVSDARLDKINARIKEANAACCKK
jgi:hypothetical protein